jgi:hypothetical protein
VLYYQEETTEETLEMRQQNPSSQSRQGPRSTLSHFQQRLCEDAPNETQGHNEGGTKGWGLPITFKNKAHAIRTLAPSEQWSTLYELPLHHSCQLIARRTPAAEAFLWAWLQACLVRDQGTRPPTACVRSSH